MLLNDEDAPGALSASPKTTAGEWPGWTSGRSPHGSRAQADPLSSIYSLPGPAAQHFRLLHHMAFPDPASAAWTCLFEAWFPLCRILSFCTSCFIKIHGVNHFLCLRKIAGCFLDVSPLSALAGSGQRGSPLVPGGRTHRPVWWVSQPPSVGSGLSQTPGALPGQAGAAVGTRRKQAEGAGCVL